MSQVASTNDAAPAGGRRSEILGIAARIFAEKSFAAATVRDIADEAGILSGSLYHHFDSKESMVEEILTGYLETMASAYEDLVSRGDDPRTTLTRFLETAYGSVGRCHDEVTILHNDWPFLRALPRFEALDVYMARIEAAWLIALERALASGDVRPGLEPIFVFRTMMGSVLSTVRWFDPDGPLPIEEVARQQSDLLLRGLFSD